MLYGCSVEQPWGLGGVVIKASGECGGGNSCEGHCTKDGSRYSRLDASPVITGPSPFKPEQELDTPRSSGGSRPSRQREDSQLSDAVNAHTAAPIKPWQIAKEADVGGLTDIDLDAFVGEAQKAQKALMSTDVDLDDMDCVDFEEPSSAVLRRIEELEDALEHLKGCKDNVTTELLSMMYQTTEDNVTNIVETRSKVEHLERTIVDQAAQIMTLTSQLARELATLDGHGFFLEDDEEDEGEFGFHEESHRDWPSDDHGHAATGSEDTIFLHTRQLLNGLEDPPSSLGASPAVREQEREGFHDPRFAPGRDTPGHYSDVLELFDDLSNEGTGGLHLRPSLVPGDRDGVVPTSSGQPGPVLSEEEDMLVDDGYQFQKMIEPSPVSHGIGDGPARVEDSLALATAAMVAKL